MTFTIGQAAERTGLSIDTLRYYERAGLVPRPVARDPAGRRTYDEDDLAWFGVCSSMRRSGMPIAILRRYVALVRAGEGNEDERLSILERHQAQVDAELATLQQARGVIAYKVAFYRGRVADGSAGEVWVGTAGEDDGARERADDDLT